MLKKIKTKKSSGSGGHYAIVASRYNARYVDSMLRAARLILAQAGVSEVKVIRVPGAFEIPVVAARLAKKSLAPYDAIICLGVVIRGETAHAQLISESVSTALAQLQVLHGVPVVHGVLLLENEAQAQVRCLDARHNRGVEAAQTALAMAQVMHTL
jgi:6,7-dimethyl-8-ribityllumazine synthase